MLWKFLLWNRLFSLQQFVAYPEYPSGSVNSLWLSDLRNTVEMKGFVDAPNYFIELLEGGTTLEDVIDNHVYEQNLVSSGNWLSSCMMNVCLSKKIKHGCFFIFFIVWSDFVPQAEKNAFVVADLGALMRQHVLWKTTMPLVRPFYPVCCNSSPVVIEVLSALGVGFVCANKVTLKCSYLKILERSQNIYFETAHWILRHTI